MYGNCVVNYTKKEIVYQGKPLSSPHDLAFVKNGFFVNSSFRSETYFYSFSNGHLTKAVTDLDTDSLMRSKHTASHAIEGFTRGLEVFVNRNQLLICSSPGNLLLYDTGLKEIIDKRTLFSDPKETIYDVVCLEG